MEIVSAAAGVAGLISLAGQTIQGIIKLKTFFVDVSRSQKTILEFLHEIECLNRTLEDVRSLLSKIQRQATISSSDGSVATLEAFLVDCSTDIKEWIIDAEKINPASRKGAEAFFKRFRVAVNKRGISDLGRRVANHQSRIGTSISVLGRSLDFLTLEGISDANSKIDNMTKSQSDGALRDWIPAIYAEQALSRKIDRIETSSHVSMENSVHSARSLDSVSSMVSQIHSTVSKWNSVISSGQHELPSARTGSAASSENGISAAVVATEKKKDRIAAYRCYFPCCYWGEMSTFRDFRHHFAFKHDDIEPELSSLLERLAPEDVQVWSCDALLGIEDAFDVDLCYYCGEDFHASPPDWNARGKHLVTKHNFGRCSTSLEQYSSLDFGEHLRHTHHAKQDTLMNTVFMRKFFTGESLWASGISSEKSSQSASNYNDLPKESAEVAALFQVQIRLLFDEFKQTQRSDSNDTTLLQDARVEFQDDIASHLQTLQIDAARIQEQFIVDGHFFDALNLSWDLCSSMRTQNLRGTLNPRNDIDRMNLIDDIAGKDLLGNWKYTRDRINWWLLHMLRFSKTATTLIRSTLGIYDLKKGSENNWIRSVLEQWSVDEAATHHEWPLMLSDGAVDSRDDPHLMFRSPTPLIEIQSVTNAIDSFLFKPKNSESSHSELAKTAIMAQFIKTSGLCNTAVETTLDKVNKPGVRYLNQKKMEQAEYMYPRALTGKEKVWGAEDTSTLDTLNYLADLYINQGKMRKAEDIYLRAIEEYERTWGDDHTSTLDLVNNLGVLYSCQGKLKEAEDMYQRVLAGQEKTLDAGHILSIHAANNLGLLYSDQDKIKAAEDLYLRALAGYEKARGAEYIPSLTTVNNLGLLYSKQGKMKEAEGMYLRALAGYEKARDAEYIPLLTTVNNLGLLYSSQGKTEEAKAMFQRALAGYEKAGSTKQISMFDTFNNLANLYRNQGKMEKAEDMYLQALEGNQKTWIVKRESTINTLNDLANLYQDQGKMVEAEDLYLLALAEKDRAWGGEHTTTLDTVNDLGILYSNQGKTKQAEELFLRALAGYEKFWGAEHTSTLSIVNNLGALYKNQEKMKDAEKMYLRALAGYKAIWGAGHTLTLGMIRNLGLMYSKQGRMKAAEDMYLQALAGYEKAWSAEHTLTLDAVSNLGLLYSNQGKIKEAEDMYLRALVGREKTLGAEHLSTLNTVNNLGVLYSYQGRMKEAEDMYLRALAGMEKAWGAEHTLTLDTVNNLANLYKNQGKMNEAEDMYLRALAGREKTLGAEHTSTLDTLNNLGVLYSDQGFLYLDQGWLKEIKDTFQQALAGYEKVWGAEHKQPLDTRYNIAKLYNVNRQFNDAIEQPELVVQGERICRERSKIAQHEGHKRPSRSKMKKRCSKQR
ncbi:hypothetical protein MMC29_006925 [Sticta canariensis]|nr:hypothetical protein [Sticta canariensis]